MNILIRRYEEEDIGNMINIWNEVVEEGIAFPQEELLDQNTGKDFFDSQTYCGVAQDMDTHRIYGLYILHPNNVGRCGHICNASYAVDKSSRGLHVGEALVKDCLRQAKTRAMACCSLMQWLPQIPMQGICMNGLVLYSLGQFLKGSG